MAIALKQFKLVYKPVPKAACSSIKAGLALLDGRTGIKRDELLRDVSLAHGIYQTTRFKRREWPLYRGYFRFTVVRDPLKRILSVYTNRVVDYRDLEKSRKLRNLRDQYPVDPDPDFFFQNLGAVYAKFFGDPASCVAYAPFYRARSIPVLKGITGRRRFRSLLRT